eukprot:1809070-Pleurochrysis_carterae.AAC.1
MPMLMLLVNPAKRMAHIILNRQECDWRMIRVICGMPRARDLPGQINCPQACKRALPTPMAYAISSLEK